MHVGWVEAGMRVSVYEGWRSELWGTWWCPGWQPRWHYLRVCCGRKPEENRREGERGRRRWGKRKRGRQKEMSAERERKSEGEGRSGWKEGLLAKRHQRTKGYKTDRTGDSGSKRTKETFNLNVLPRRNRRSVIQHCTWLIPLSLFLTFWKLVMQCVRKATDFPERYCPKRFVEKFYTCVFACAIDSFPPYICAINHKAKLY